MEASLRSSTCWLYTPMSLWNFTIPDTSPILSYCQCPVLVASICSLAYLCVKSTVPYGERLCEVTLASSYNSGYIADGSDYHNGWQAWYTTSGFNTKPGDSPQGTSYHVTALTGAQITLQFYGEKFVKVWFSASSYWNCQAPQCTCSVKQTLRTM